MNWRWGHQMLWSVVVLVVAVFLLAVAGEEVASPQTRELILSWHEWLGLATLPILIAALGVRWWGRYRYRPPLPQWLPHLRQSIRLALYVLLFVQPLSGWLLASHEGTVASLLPPLVSPDSILADFGYIYHGAGGLLIVLIAAFGIRLHATAFVAGLLPKTRARRRHVQKRSAS